MTGQFEGALGIEDVLAREGVYVGTTAGVSMWPLLRHRRDTVVVEPCAGRLRVHDVPLYLSLIHISRWLMGSFTLAPHTARHRHGRTW